MPSTCNARFAMALVALAGSLAATHPARAAQLLGKHNDWVSYAHEEGGQKLCFLTSEPKARQAAGVPREAPHFYVSAWPKAGVRAEVSVRLGFPVKKEAEVVVSIDDQKWRLFVDGERAFVGDQTQELKLIEAMKKGQRMLVEATSEGGAKVVDTYSLSGITQGLQSLGGACQ
jgi:invasion protein IalB